MAGYRLVLASSSPRRVALLRLLGIPFRTDVSAVDEVFDDARDLQDIAREMALAKAQAVLRRHQGEIILAADTLISFAGRLLGKPLDSDDARAVLRSLRGRWHRVVTGVAVINGATGAVLAGCEETRVLMRRYTDAEIEQYVASGDPLDKAAAYAIQSASFHPVARLRGCYTNVMGLPLCTVHEMLLQVGLTVPSKASGLRSASCQYCIEAQQLSSRPGSITLQADDSSC